MTELEKTFNTSWHDNFYHGNYKDCAFVGFKAGAEWQSNQSPWISVEERLPDPNEMVLCRMRSNGAIVGGFIQIIRDHKPKVLTLPNFEFEDNMDYEPAYWMPIPADITKTEGGL